MKRIYNRKKIREFKKLLFKSEKNLKTKRLIFENESNDKNATNNMNTTESVKYDMIPEK